MIPFKDGSSQRLCRWSKVDLVTTPGTPSGAGVRPVPRTTQVRDPSLAEAIVIHEMLHTLGLGENPPTSTEITKRVKGRCSLQARRPDAGPSGHRRREADSLTQPRLGSAGAATEGDATWSRTRMPRRPSARPRLAPLPLTATSGTMRTAFSPTICMSCIAV